MGLPWGVGVAGLVRRTPPPQCRGQERRPQPPHPLAHAEPGRPLGPAWEACGGGKGAAGGGVPVGGGLDKGGRDAAVLSPQRGEWEAERARLASASPASSPPPGLSDFAGCSKEGRAAAPTFAG